MTATLRRAAQTYRRRLLQTQSQISQAEQKISNSALTPKEKKWIKIAIIVAIVVVALAVLSLLCCIIRCICMPCCCAARLVK